MTLHFTYWYNQLVADTVRGPGPKFACLVWVTIGLCCAISAWLLLLVAAFKPWWRDLWLQCSQGASWTMTDWEVSAVCQCVGVVGALISICVLSLTVCVALCSFACADMCGFVLCVVG